MKKALVIIAIIAFAVIFWHGSKPMDTAQEEAPSAIMPAVSEQGAAVLEQPVQDIAEETRQEEAREAFVQSFEYQPIDQEVQKRIWGISWKPGSPVEIEDLRYLRVTYWGYDEQPHTGELIVHKAVAKEVTEIFEELYQAKFPIEKIKLIDEYAAEDSRSMEDNNTSAYCFREVEGKPGKLSRHSYGIAIDINPIQNPYVYKNEISPAAGKDFTDRSKVSKGMILKNDVCYEAFVSRGWTWGGDWNYEKDYQHFQKDLKSIK